MNLIWEDVETPKNFRKYKKDIGETMKMWKVQTMGYKKGSVLGAGLVSRGKGFLDAPDAEFISEGNHTKRSGQIAIGRHGNFLHWGFSGGPKHMTKQGKLVFLNAIHYIAKFKGKRPLSPKLSGTMWFRDQLKKKVNKDFKKKWEEYQKSSNAYYQRALAAQKTAREKVKTGEDLTEKEKRALNHKIRKPYTLEEYLNRYEKSLFSKLGTDLEKYSDFYNENANYLRADPKYPRNFIVDMEAKKLGKSFYDEDFIPYCIDALNDHTKKELALVLLKRYTTVSFNTYEEWNNWYTKNKDRLFFSEQGGCKNYINIYKK